MSAFAREVQKKFDSAKEGKDLFSFETTEVEKESGGMNVSIRHYVKRHWEQKKDLLATSLSLLWLLLSVKKMRPSKKRRRARRSPTLS